MAKLLTLEEAADLGRRLREYRAKFKATQQEVARAIENWPNRVRHAERDMCRGVYLAGRLTELMDSGLAPRAFQERNWQAAYERKVARTESGDYE